MPWRIYVAKALYDSALQRATFVSEAWTRQQAPVAGTTTIPGRCGVSKSERTTLQNHSGQAVTPCWTEP